jgi:Raf kinase inhibitor-like YbhB/YbcL family protein
MKITSSVFNYHELIPKKYTCDAENINPPLNFDEFPEETQQLALIVDDPDARAETWVHWVIYNMPVISHIDENSAPGTQGPNDRGNKNYSGPCPPSGKHRYYFKLYALNSKKVLKEGLNKLQLEAAMKGHILEKAELVGLYSRN